MLGEDVIDVDGVEAKSNFSESSVDEYVELSNKPKLLPGDSVLYRFDNQEAWMPVYGTVLYKPPANQQKSEPVNLSSSGIEMTSQVSVESEPNDFHEVKLDEDEEDELIHVRWALSNRAGPVNESRLCLVDRMLERGQFVENKDGMFGVVTGKEVRATVQILDSDQVIKDVLVSNLRPMTPFVRGQYISYENWIGIIVSVTRHLYFRLDGGMVFYLESVENDGFEKSDIYNVSERTCPGARTKLPYSVFRRAHWIPSAMKFLSKWFPPLPYLYSFSPVTIARTHVVEVSVEWLSCLSTNPTDQPPRDLSEAIFERIHPIGIPSSELINMNSVRIHRLKPEDPLINFSTWLRGFRSEFMADMLEIPQATGSGIIQIESSPEVDVPVKVILVQTYAEVEWGDGTKELILAKKIPEVCQMDIDITHRPGIVLTHALKRQTSRYGVVQTSASTNKAKKTILVKWIEPETQANDSITVDLGITEESIYDVQPHPKYSLYQRGTIVMFNDPMDGEVGGAVIDVDIRAAQMIIGTPMASNSLKVWPHTVTPVTKRAFWNFFSRQWLVHDVLPPPHQLGTELGSTVAENPGIVLNMRNYNTVNPVRNWAPDIPHFQLLEAAPEDHTFIKNIAEMELMDDAFHRNLQKEFNFLQDNVPTGIWIRAYENRMDLISVLLLGEIETPYEDGLFMFDIQLHSDFPARLPRIKFVIYSNRLSPFTDHDGSFCTSKLVWEFENSPTSYILNLCHQLQRLLFHAEPFFEDDRNQVLKGTQLGQELSRDFNEKVYIEVLTSFHNMAFKPHDPWEFHTASHLDNILPYKIREVRQWLRMSAQTGEEAEALQDEVDYGDTIAPPPYPLLPFSKGFEMAFDTRYSKMQQFFQGAEAEIKTPSANTIFQSPTVSETKEKEPTESLNESDILSDEGDEEAEEYIEVVITE